MYGCFWQAGEIPAGPLRGAGGIDPRSAAAWNWVGLRAPHGRKKPPLCKGRWHGFAVTEGLYLAATPNLGFAALPVIDTRRAAAWNWVGLRAPHGRSLFYEKSDQKRATRSLWSNPS